jgi:hypothetical protein
MYKDEEINEMYKDEEINEMYTNSSVSVMKNVLMSLKTIEFLLDLYILYFVISHILNR